MNSEIWDRAEVPGAKLTDYLLALDHPVGASKAYKLRRAGFHPADPDALAKALAKQARQGKIVARMATRYGIKWIVDGPLLTPDGGRFMWRTVWIVAYGKTTPRFVTAHPIRTRMPRS